MATVYGIAVLHALGALRAGIDPRANGDHSADGSQPLSRAVGHDAVVGAAGPGLAASAGKPSPLSSIRSPSAPPRSSQVWLKWQGTRAATGRTAGHHRRNRPGSQQMTETAAAWPARTLRYASWFSGPWERRAWRTSPAAGAWVSLAWMAGESTLGLPPGTCCPQRRPPRCSRAWPPLPCCYWRQPTRLSPWPWLRPSPARDVAPGMAVTAASWPPDPAQPLAAGPARDHG